MVTKKPSGTYLINYRKADGKGGFINVRAKNRKELDSLAKKRGYNLLSAKRNYLKK